MQEEKVTAISLSHVSKSFQLPHEKKDSVKGLFMNMLSIGNKTFEEQRALNDITFEVNKGEFFGIVGRNGSGKSTLLKIIASIYQPSKGHVVVHGRLVPFIELGVGFNPELTGRENVHLNGALLGFSQREIDAKYQAIVDFAEIERFMDQKLKNYSSGMQVRLAFSVATVLAESDILLIDEVLAVGDADFQRKCFKYFKNMKKEGKTVIFVSHDMNAIREYCDRAILIEKNEIIATGTAEEVAIKYTKLFMHDEQGAGADDEEKRWGDGVMTFDEPKITISDNELMLRVMAEAKQDCDNPIFGFTIKNGAGTNIMGTNTMLERAKLTSMKKGASTTIEWRVPNIFSDGEYTVTLAALYDSGTTTSDWWEDACSFSVTKLTRSPYIVMPDVKTVIREKK